MIRESHNTLYVPQCGILLYSLIVTSMWLLSLRTKKRWYEGLKLLYLFVDLLVSLGYLTWEHLGMSLSGIRELNLYCQFAWCWYDLLDINLDIKVISFLDWHPEISLAQKKNLWLGFHWAQRLDWRLEQDRNLWLEYHWDFHLEIHLSIQILDIFMFICLYIWMI